MSSVKKFVFRIFPNVAAVCRPESSRFDFSETRTELLPEKLQADVALNVRLDFYTRVEFHFYGKSCLTGPF